MSVVRVPVTMWLLSFTLPAAYSGTISTKGNSCRCGTLQGDLSGRGLHFVDFDLVVLDLPYSAWAAANLAELAWHVGNMVKLPDQSQQSIVADLMGHLVPVV